MAGGTIFGAPYGPYRRSRGPEVDHAERGWWVAGESCALCGCSSMKVTLFSCGPAANESELLAFKHLESRLQSTAGDDEWILLTNLAFSDQKSVVSGRWGEEGD